MKNVLITGAGGALGEACVKEFQGKGYHVITILSPGKKTTYTSKDSISSYHADLMNEDETSSLIEKIITEHKTIDAAILLVGGFAMGSIQDTTGDLLKKMISLNFETAYYTSRSIFNQMMTQPNGGRLVFIGAKPALSASAGKDKVAYALSKSLIFKLADILNAAGSKSNVVSTVIVPSIIDTEANRKAMPKADPTNWVTAEEIASLISFAVSEEGSKLREPVLKMYGAS